MSLANKYRPQTFEDIIGQNHITDILKAQMKSEQNNNNNFLLFGPRGTGKTTIARILAKSLNCTNLNDGNPCNECDNCSTINKSSSIDYIEIDAASHTGVENVREVIIDKISYPPVQLKKKVYVIDEVHMLSKSAFNALLKTIEEPGGNVCFIFATTEIHKVPETIFSRCQVFNFKKIHEDEMIKHLERICRKENLNYDQGALEIVAKISEGCVRDAIKYIDQISILGDITQKHVTDFLGVAPEKMIKDFLEIIKGGDRDMVFKEIEKINQSGVDLVQFAKQILMYIDENLVNDMDFLLDISESFSEIVITIKNYPYPAIVYKIALNKYLSKGYKLLGVDKVIQDKQTIDENQKENKGVINQNIYTEVIKVDTAKVTTKKQDINQNFDDIWNNILNKINKVSLQQNLRGNFIIEEIDDNLVKAIVINKMTKILLDNDENKRILESAFADVMSDRIKLEINFENKETYFARKLG